MEPKIKRINSLIKEALGNDPNSVSTPAQVIKFSDNPLVDEVKKLFKEDKELKNYELVRIEGNGDVWCMDIRCTMPQDGHAQTFREQGKAEAYKIKRIIEGHLMKMFNIPPMSIQGVRTSEGVVEFSISFIYIYKGNIRPQYESKIVKTIENVLKEDSQSEEVKKK